MPFCQKILQKNGFIFNSVQRNSVITRLQRTVEIYSVPTKTLLMVGPSNCMAVFVFGKPNGISAGARSFVYIYIVFRKIFGKPFLQRNLIRFLFHYWERFPI